MRLRHFGPLALLLWDPGALAIRAQTPSLRTRIDNIVVFLERCPANDPAYAQIRKDFTIRRDGVVAGDVRCTEPYAGMPIAELSNELIALQALRVAYYMDPGIPNYLPWTSQSLYQWMAANVGGINLKSAPGQLECCDVIRGKKYVVQSIQSDQQREDKREWPGLSSTLDFFVHEIRHASRGPAPAHTTGCVAFPSRGGRVGCDQSYDVSNLGSYGTQYWLVQSWMTGHLNIGIACTPSKAASYVEQHLRALNLQFRNRFVAKIPPEATMPPMPYGGPCPTP